MRSPLKTMVPRRGCATGYLTVFLHKQCEACMKYAWDRGEAFCYRGNGAYAVITGDRPRRRKCPDFIPRR